MKKLTVVIVLSIMIIIVGSLFLMKSDWLKVNQIYDQEDQTQNLITNQESLIDITNIEDEDLETQIQFFRAFNENPVLQYESKIIELYDINRNRRISVWNDEKNSPYLSDVFTQTTHLFLLNCEALGAIGSKETIDLLEKETDPKKWDKEFEGDNAKNLSAQKITDTFFRQYLFLGLLKAAVNQPELFETVESYPDEYLRGTKSNVIYDWLPNYKEEYYGKNPNQIPEKGYEVLPIPEEINKEYYKFFFLGDRISKYLEKKDKLPNRIIDLTFPHGGDFVYLPIDHYQEKTESFYDYHHKQIGESWVYILASPGPNHIFEIDKNIINLNTPTLEVGFANSPEADLEAAKEMFPNYIDDIFMIRKKYSTR